MNVTEEQVSKLETQMSEFGKRWPGFQDIPATLTQIGERLDKSEHQLKSIRAKLASQALMRSNPLAPSDDLCLHFGSTFVLHCAASGRLESLSSHSHTRDRLLAEAKSFLGLTTRTALGTGDIPLPTEYSGQIRELISSFGVIRKHMAPYPIGLGVSRPPRMGTRPAFASITMSSAFPEKSPSVTFASLESHKVGGVVKLPREIDEQSIVNMGRYLANYGIIEFARAEDQWGFLADGTGTFETVKGIVTTAREVGKQLILTTGKTKPSDATLDDFRAIRRLVNKAALSGRRSAYFIDSTWETRLPSFKTQAEPNVYQRLPDGSALLDGYPVIWTDVMQQYDTIATPDKPLAVFGDLSFWWFGEHGSPRMDTSDQVLFLNDQLAVRFIEEIDFDYCAIDATAVLITAAT